jgi:hypothetical protein
MKIRKEKKLITFKHAPDNAFITPIVPASKTLPDWYKKASILKEGDPPFAAQHIKSCLPFFDAMTQGYIVPLWSDVHVRTDIDGETGQLGPIFTWKDENTVIEAHVPTQTEGMPVMEGTKATGGRAFKFANPWLIETPKGYSTLFVAPLNNCNPNFQMISAIVATDSYMNQILFPFIWTGPEDYEGVITRGTPLIQLIPFKRDDFQHELRTFNEDDQNLMKSTRTRISQDFTGVYKRLWRKMVRST